MPTATHIRVYRLTRDKINSLADKWNTTQAKAMERIFLSAESVNFQTEEEPKIIEQIVTKHSNRIIGFLKTQDNNLMQVQKNLIYVMKGGNVSEIEKPEHQKRDELFKQFAEFREIEMQQIDYLFQDEKKQEVARKLLATIHDRVDENLKNAR